MLFIFCIFAHVNLKMKAYNVKYGTKVIVTDERI